jgi:hypothetical protein
MRLVELGRTVGTALGRIARQASPAPRSPHPYIPAPLGATEDQVNMRLTVPERINSVGSKVEDIVGTGKHDSLGG